MINWNTVLTSVVTAIVVTLLVEYAAKPRLEARKERILDIVRARRELGAALIPIAQAADMLLADPLAEPLKDAPRELREKFRAERQRGYDRMQGQIQQLMDNVGRYAGCYPSLHMNLVMRFVMCAWGVMISLRTQHEQARIIKALVEQMATALEPSLWRPLAWKRAHDETMRLIDEAELPDKQSPAPAIP